MPAFAATSPKRRIITASVLLLLVSTVVPYQFAYLVACIVQIATCVRAFRHAQENVSPRDGNLPSLIIANPCNVAIGSQS